jgi:hypothetical protein
MPTQARKPCSGCVRSRRMISTSAEVWRPIAPACRLMRHRRLLIDQLVLQQQGFSHDNTYSTRAHEFGHGCQRMNGEYEQVKHRPGR